MDHSTTIESLRSRFPQAVGPPRTPGSVATATPHSPQQAAEMARCLSEAGVGVFPTGSPAASRKEVRAAGWVALSTERLTRIISHDPRDLTVEVEAGVTVAALNETLAAAGQHLPVDPPLPERTTVGELIAGNGSGPLRFGHGTVRDFILSLRVVLPDGRLVKSGARVAKNTAGLDVHRLFVGSRGSLGLVTAASFRVRPVPERFAAVLLHPPDGSTARLWLDRLMLGAVRPVFLELLNSRAAAQLHIEAPLGAWLLAVGLVGSARNVEWQMEYLAGEFGERSMRLEAAEARELYEAVRDWPARDHAVGFAASVPSAEVVALVEEAAWSPLSVIAHAGNGVVVARGGPAVADEALRPVFDFVMRVGGSLRLTRASAGLQLPRWAGRSHDLELMRRVKSVFDPAGLFNPLPF